LFERLNTGGIRLTDQEIRSCVFRGKFNDTLRELAKDPNFLKSVRLSKEHANDGTKEELVLRFFAFLHKYREFDHSVINFLNDYMRDASSSFKYDENVRLFKETFKHLSKIPDGITRGRAATPINLFEAVAAGAALALRKNGRLRVATVKNWIASEELTRLTSAATNSKRMVSGRIEFCLKKFSGR
jgi:hypothetical protein